LAAFYLTWRPCPSTFGVAIKTDLESILKFFTAKFAKSKKQTPSFLKSTLRGGSAQIGHEKFKKLGELGAFLTCTCSAGASVASWR
jgi:hypothetical protein